MTNSVQITFGAFEKPYLCNGCLNRGSTASATTPQIIYLATTHYNDTATSKTVSNYCFYCAVNIIGGYMQRLYAIQGQREHYRDLSRVERKE